MYFHPEEGFETGIIEEYAMSHSRTEYLIEFGPDEAYICELDAIFESDNIAEIESLTGTEFHDGDPGYDEFHQAAYQVVQVIKDGPHRYNTGILVDYRDFPTRIVDVTRNVQVYPALTQALPDHA